MCAPSTYRLADSGHDDGRRELLAGARAMAPWLVGIVPFGLVIGVSTARARIPSAAGWVATPLILGGSAQAAVINLLDAGAAPAVVIVAALAVHLRLVLYSGAMASHWRGTPRWWRALAAATLIDPSFVVGVEGYERLGDNWCGHRFYAGAAALLSGAWIVAVAVGATAGLALPAALHVDFVIPLFLAGEVAVRLRARAAWFAAVAAGAVAVAALRAPMQLGPLLAMAAGVAAGVRADRPSGSPR